MKISFMGAARTVTGSCYICETGGHRFAVDCGMHQGNDEIDKRNSATALYRPEEIEFILITHAHIDHSGLLPKLVKDGFKGPIYATTATRDLLEIMLLDSAHIQEMEAEWKTKKSKRHGDTMIEPLYDQADAEDAVKLIKPVEYEKSFHPAQGLRVTYHDAGHILGSGLIELEFKEDDTTQTIVFSGDLGRPNQLLINDPSVIKKADYLFIESTYGDRDHKNESDSRAELAEAISYSYQRGEKVIIPAFAVERTQEIIYSLYCLSKEGKLPSNMPVYVDSPMAIRVTDVFRNHPEYLDPETRNLIEAGENPLDLANLKFTMKTAESQAINNTAGPAVVISASGMANAGRIKHHLRHNLWKEGASVVFVGYQAVGTPGRRIVDGANRIRILGEEVAVKAKIFTIGGFSAHAGMSQLMEWMENFRSEHLQVILVHGEPAAQDNLAGLIQKKFGWKVHIPDYLENLTLKLDRTIEPSVDEEAVRKMAPGIDWDFLVKDSEALFEEFKKRLDKAKQSSWADQAEIRNRLLEINKLIVEMVSEL